MEEGRITIWQLKLTSIEKANHLDIEKVDIYISTGMPFFKSMNLKKNIFVTQIICLYKYLFGCEFL